MRKVKETETGGNEAEAAIRALVIDASIAGSKDRALRTEARNMGGEPKTMADSLSRIATCEQQMSGDNADLQAIRAKTNRLELKELGAAMIRGTTTPSMRARMAGIVGTSPRLPSLQASSSGANMVNPRALP